MKKNLLTVAIATTLAATPAFAVTKEVVVDISNNLYYSGLPLKLDPSNPHNIPSAGYPTSPLTWEKYSATAIRSCLRNAPPVDATGNPIWDAYGDIANEVDPTTLTNAVINSVTDDQRGCYGSPPVIIDVTGLPNPFYIKVQGTIDNDTAAGSGATNIPPVDARGQLDSADSAISENGINAYALVGIWASNPEDDLKAHVDDGWATNPSGLLGNPGFTVIGGSEFGVVEGLGLTRGNALTDVNPADGVADEGTGEFIGQVTVPAGATHLILGNNTRQGAFYHQGSARYSGATNPLFSLVPENIRSTSLIEGTTNANPYYLNAAATDVADTFPDDIGFGDNTSEDLGTYPAGHRRAVGVFMVTLQDTAFDAPPPAPDPAPGNSSGGGGGSVHPLALLSILSLGLALLRRRRS